MDREMQRLSSFDGCENLGSWSAINLARKGWHYDKTSNKIRCHVCYIEASLPSTSHANVTDIALHQHLSPTCPFSSDCYEYNIPVLHSSPHESRRIKTKLREYALCSHESYKDEDHKGSLRGAYPIQVQEKEGTSARAINGCIYDLDALVIGSAEPVLTSSGHLQTSQLLPNPPMMSLDVYKHSLASSWRIIDSTMACEGQDHLVV